MLWFPLPPPPPQVSRKMPLPQTRVQDLSPASVAWCRQWLSHASGTHTQLVLRARCSRCRLMAEAVLKLDGVGWEKSVRWDNRATGGGAERKTRKGPNARDTTAQLVMAAEPLWKRDLPPGTCHTGACACSIQRGVAGAGPVSHG